ncbi:MOB-like protein phocein isoform 2-T2 [Cyanocitta cristata]
MVMAEGTAVLRRNRPGTKAQDFYNWPDESFEEMDSTLAVQQYIQQNIRADCSNIDKILEPPEGQDEGVWKYEHLRQFCLELNGLAVKLQSECHPDTCTQMTATEQWIFLCAAHKTPKECPAIDYTRHTLDGAACLLNSNKYFPSRCCTSKVLNRMAPKASRSQHQSTVGRGNHRRERPRVLNGQVTPEKRLCRSQNCTPLGKSL